MPEPKPKPHKLLDLAFTEVSLVDSPANPGARVVMFKRRAAGARPGDPIGKTGDDPMPDDTKKVADLEKQVADLTKSQKALEEKLEKSEAAKTEAEAIAKMSDAEREYLKGLKGDDRKEFLEMTPAKRRKAVKAAEDDDETLTVGKRTVRKSVVGEDVFEVMKAQQAENEKNAEAIKKANERADLAVFEKRADDEFGHVPGSTEERAAMLKAVAGMDESLKKSFEAVFKQSEKLATSAFSTIGHHAKNEPTEGSAEEKLDKMAKEHASKNNIPFHKAYDVVCQTPEGQQLYKQSQDEARARARAAA